jgi:hypothetical protein
MPIYRLQVTTMPVTALVEDATTNTWHGVAEDDTDAGDFAAAVLTFHKALGAQYSNLIRQNGHIYKLYNIADAMPRAPIEEGTFNLTTAPSVGSLPTEAAVCLSFQGDPLSGVSQARRRGRVFLGPLSTTMLDSTGHVAAVQTDYLRDLGAALLTASNATLQWYWGVYSPTLGTAAEVTNGWVDNEFDTIRSRGRKTTTRDVF